MLLGRTRERQEIERVLSSARSGISTALAFVGEAGIGKTALLGYASERASGMRLLRARGVESEAQIPFASLLELLRPTLGLLDQIPRPQAVALEGALALRPGLQQERFAVGAATLSVLAAYAEGGPVAILIDDAQWLDDPSSQALRFAFRRLVADPVAVLMTVREGEPSLLDGADLLVHRLEGLTTEEAGALLSALAPEIVDRLHGSTAGNPLALLELASESNELALAPEGAPVLVPARIAKAFMRRVQTLEEPARRALVLAAASDSGDLSILTRAATYADIELGALAAAEGAGLLSLRTGSVEFRHPLVRSAIYADAPAEQRRAAHQALAAALPDRDIDRRAWHLAAAAVGADESASAALEQAGARSRDRSAYATAAAAFERAARLTAQRERRAQLLFEAASAAWLAGLADRALELLADARKYTEDPGKLVRIDRLTGHVATRRGPVMRGYAILVDAAERAEPELAVQMLAEAAGACMAAGNAAEMQDVAERALARLPEHASQRTRFMALTAAGMARIFGGNAAAGTEPLRAAVALAESSLEIRDELELLPWLVLGLNFLRDTAHGRSLLQHALSMARAQAAVGTLPFLLALIARDQATTDRWTVAEATYMEAIGLARESSQQSDLAFGLAGLAWLQSLRGREAQCRELAAEALELSAELGMGFFEVWSARALGELELGMGNPARAAEHFEHQWSRMRQLAITDVDLWPAAELVDAYLRLGRGQEAQQIADQFLAAATVKAQPWSLARALRCAGQLADEDVFSESFDRALAQHAQTPDVFEAARTQLAYGERLRRARSRIRARDQLRNAVETFERLDAGPWSERARAELAATGETVRRRDPTTLDELTPQELQIGLLLAAGRTTREAAAALFLSPKTIEYHLRHVYLKLGINSREQLARELDPSRDAGEPLAVSPK